MKILYLHQHFATPNMPGITRTYEMAQRLAAMGHEVHVITTDQSPSQVAVRFYTTKEQNVWVHWFPNRYSNKMGYPRRLLAFLRFACALPRKMRELSPADVILASSPPLTIATPAIVGARILRIPYVLEVRDLWPELAIAMQILETRFLIVLARLLEKLAYRDARHIIALSPGMKAQIVRQKVRASKITVIPNCCDHELFDTTEKERKSTRAKMSFLKGRKLVLYAGTIGFANQLEYVVRMAARSKQRGHKLCYVVMGSGKEETLIRDLAADLGVLDDNFFLLPPVPKSEIPKFFAAADINLNVLRGAKELGNSSPNKFFDSIAAGVPVAINFGGWLSTLLKKTGAGLVLPPGQPTEAADLLNQSLWTSGWQARAGRAASTLGKKHFSRAFHARRLERVLLDAVGHSRKPRPRSKRAA